MTGAVHSLDICTSDCADSCNRHQPNAGSEELSLLRRRRLELLDGKDSSSQTIERIWNNGTTTYDTTPFDTTHDTTLYATREAYSEQCQRIDGVLAQILDYDADTGKENPLLAVQVAREISDKFQLWKDHSGSTHPPHSQLSLEYRLTNAPHLVEEFDDLLESLVEALQDVLDIMSGSQQNQQIVKEVYGPEDDVLSKSPAKVSITTTEIDDLMGTASNTVRCLLRLIKLVQKAPPRHPDDFAVGRQPDLMISFDTDYVKECHPKLDRPGTRWLVERLGRAITTRRQFFWSLRDRGGPMDRTDPRDRERRSRTIPSDAPKSRKALEPPRTESQARENDPSETKAAEKSLINRRALLHEDTESTEDAPTQVSVIPSATPQPEDKPLSIPRLEDIKRDNEGKESFRCPLCAIEVSIDSERSWMLHAHKDLKSYVCCLGEGQCDSQLFGSQEAWFDHELKHHRRQWICVVCKSGPFHEADEFTGHLEDIHPGIELSDEAKNALQDASQCPIQAIMAKDCPFCDDWDLSMRSSRVSSDKGKSVSGMTQESPTVPSIEFRGHVAVHLEQLSVSSISRGIIPRTDHPGASNDGNNAHPLRINPTPASGEQETSTLALLGRK